MKPQKDFSVFALSVGVIILAVFYIMGVVGGTSGKSERSLHIPPSDMSIPNAVFPVTLSSSSLQSTCPIQEKKVTVVGTSLSGFIAPGTALTVLSGYFACHDPKPGDVVIYLYGGSSASDLLIKVVKGVPGDAVSFQKAGGAWNILVNGRLLETSTAIPYAITGQVFEIFSRYVSEVNGVIPPDHYLILGNLPAGSIDSTRFGFVPKDALVGKVRE